MASLSSLEMKAMLAHTEELTTALSTNPLSTVGLLLEKKIVPSEVQDKMMADKTREGKAAILVEAVTHEIESSPHKLGLFLQILSEQTWTIAVGERLFSTYQSHQRRVALVPYHSPLQSADNQPQHDDLSVLDQSLQDEKTAYTAPSAAEKAIEQILTEKDLVILLNLLHDFSHKWFDIGISLGFFPSELNLIRTMPSLFMKAPVSYLTKLLSQWVQWPTAKHPTKANLKTLCVTLRSSIVGLGNLADKVEREIKSLKIGITSNPLHWENPLDVEVAAKIGNFQDRFCNLRRCTRSGLINRSANAVDILDALADLPVQLINEYEDAIKVTPSFQVCIRKLFIHLNPHLSFIDYGLLDYIIKQFCSDNLKEDMRSYSSDMQKFMKETTIEQLIGHIPGQFQEDHNFSLLEAKIGLDAGKYTLKKVNDIRFCYCSKVKLSKIIFHLVAITKSNSFIVKWLVPSVIVSDLMISTRAIESSFFQENAIISLSLNKTWLYDETTSTTIAQFSSLHEQTRFELSESKRSVEDLALCLAEKLTSLEEGDSIHLIELILKKSLLSVADFEILNFIVQKYGSDNLKEKMQTYVDGITISAKQITVQKMMDLMPDHPECPKNFVPIECRIMEEPSHYTLDRVLSLQEKFVSDMKFNKLTLLSFKFRNPRISGSFSVSWLVPTHQASHLMSLNQVESDMFLREKIASLSIGSKLLYYSKLFEFGDELKIQYRQFQMGKSPFEWLSSTPRKVFRLALIHGEKLRGGQKKDKFVQMSISSRVDDILHAKTPVELEDLFRSKGHGSEIILIEGSPSSGRSSLTTHIIHKWAQGELFEEFTLVILVQLGDPAVQRAQSISDLLPSQDVELAQQLAAELEATKGRGVLWILDGWDELPPHLQEDSIFSKLLPPKPTSQHKQRLLTDSSVIVTCRPISAGDLHPVVSSRVEILGLNPEEQRQYFTECLKGDTKLLQLFLKKFEDNLIIQSTCYIPINAALTVHYFTVKNHSLPSSEYELFSTIIINCIQHHLEKEGKEHVLPIELKSLSDLLRCEPICDLFGELCELAYRGMIQKKVTFSSSELPQGSNTLGLLRVIKSFLEGGKSVFYTFLHHPLQELLAAMHIATSLPDSDQVSQFQQLFYQPHYVGVFRFYSAITKLETPGVDKAVVKTYSKFLEPQRMHLLRCLQEAQNPSLCQLLAEQFGFHLPILDSISPLDFLSIGYFISMSNNDKALQVYLYHNIGDDGVKHLTKHLCDSSSPYSVTQGANPKQLARWKFVMYSNDIHDDGAAYVAKVLQSSHVMNSLNLSHSEIGGKGLQSICQALITNTSLFKLDLCDCKLVISEENGPVISEMLEKNITLEVLRLSDNPSISDTGMFYIAEGLQKNTSLKTLKMNHINEKGGKALATAIATNTSLPLVDLDIDDLEITEDSGPVWVDMLQQNTSLKDISISLSSSLPSDIGVYFIAEGLQKHTSLKTLSLIRSKITSVEAMYLSKMLMVNKCLTSLDMSDNPISDEGVAHLAESLKQNKTLKYLDIDYCNITDTGVASLTDALRTNNSLNRLNLRGNYALTEKGVRPLLDVCNRKSRRHVYVRLPNNLSLLRKEDEHKRFGLRDTLPSSSEFYTPFTSSHTKTGTTAMISELEPSSTEYKTSTDFTSPWHQKTKTELTSSVLEDKTSTKFTSHHKTTTASAPVITIQPENQHMDYYGDDVVLSVQANASFGVLTYEWFKDGEVIDPNIYPYVREVESPNLVISPFMPEYEGHYKCRVGNEGGFVDTNEAQLCVNLPDRLFLCREEIGNKGGTIKSTGITLQIPKDAVLPGETCTITIYASVHGPSVQSDIHLVSPVFHVKCVPDGHFKKEIKVIFDHFTNLETETDVSSLVLMVSSKGEDFHPSGQVFSQVGSRQGTAYVTHFCKVAYATKKPKYQYSMLIALPEKCCSQYRRVWAFFCISVTNETYYKIFEDYLSKFKNHPFHPIDDTEIESIEDEVELEIPDKCVNQYRICSSRLPAKILKRYVESSSDQKSYPPRIRLDVSLSVPHYPVSALMHPIPVKGVSDVTHFQLNVDYEHTKQETDTILCNGGHHSVLFKQLYKYAAKWKEIAIYLGFKPGEYDNIQASPLNLNGAPKSWLSAMLAEWLEWAPGDERGSKNYATLSGLKSAVREAGLGRTAEELTLSNTSPK